MVGDRAALPAGDHLTTSSQGKTINLLLVRSDGMCGSSHLRFFSREKREPVIGNE